MAATSNYFSYHLLTASAVCVLTGFGSFVMAGETTAHDQEITRKIRINLVGDEQLSVQAKNIHIQVVDGQVTLIGPVHSLGEEKRVLKNAGEVVGTNKVINNLEVQHQ